MRPSFPTPQGLQPMCHPSKLARVQKRIQRTIQVRLSFQIDGFFTGLWQKYGNTQLMNKTVDWSFKRFSKNVSDGIFPSNKKILNVSQTGTAFHGICPSSFIQTWLQQYRRRTFFTLLTALSAISCVCDLCGVDVQWFSKKYLHKLCHSAPRTFASSFRFPEKFVFLHGYDWIHLVAKSCTTTAYRWLFRDSQPAMRTLWSAVIKSPKFSARNTTLPIRLLHGALVIFGPLADLAISVFREVDMKNCVYPNPHFSWALKMVHEKNLRVSLCVQDLFHPQDYLWILGNHSGMSE